MKIECRASVHRIYQRDHAVQLIEDDQIWGRHQRMNDWNRVCQPRGLDDDPLEACAMVPSADQISESLMEIILDLATDTSAL